MPSPRRLRLLMLTTLVTVVIILFYTSRLDDQHDTRTIRDFYHKTVDGMGEKGPPGQHVLNAKSGGGRVGDDDAKRTAAATKERLKAAEQEAKANGKALRPNPPSEVVGKRNSAGGQVKKAKAGKADAVASPAPEKEADTMETRAEHQAESELSSILKRSPVILFSKTYCPFSKMAKKLLLEKYRIKPDPYIVELDEHKLGRQLKDLLNEKTGRKTVPNFLINGVSLGGSDELAELDQAGELMAKVRQLGNKHVEISPR